MTAPYLQPSREAAVAAITGAAAPPAFCDAAQNLTTTDGHN